MCDWWGSLLWLDVIGTLTFHLHLRDIDGVLVVNGWDGMGWLLREFGGGDGGGVQEGGGCCLFYLLSIITSYFHCYTTKCTFAFSSFLLSTKFPKSTRCYPKFSPQLLL